MKFTLAYNPDRYGWADATIQNEGENYKISSISYLSDAFKSLSEAIAALVSQNAPESDCAFDHEPGRTKIRFIRKRDQVQIEIYEFENELRNEEWDKGTIVFHTQTDLRRLRHQYLEEADRIMNDIGIKEYLDRWGYEFPIYEYKQIKTPNKSA